MTCYPTTLLPPSLPYKDIDDIIDKMCDHCLKKQYDDTLTESMKQQHFDLSMKIMEFWYQELLIEDLV